MVSFYDSISINWFWLIYLLLLNYVAHAIFIISGYYEVDTAVVRETMKVITPPITDMSIVGTYIARECQDLPTYMLEKVNSSSS